jgi:hypothetical protein
VLVLRGARIFAQLGIGEIADAELSQSLCNPRCQENATGAGFMPSNPENTKKPYSSPRLSTLDARAVKAKLADGNPKDPIVLKMLSFLDGQPHKQKVNRIPSPEKDPAKE